MNPFFRYTKLMLAAFSIVVAGILVGCGGGGGAAGTAGTSTYYANWYCTSSQCASIMGGYTGTAGPFSSAAACEQWRQTYILTSSCSATPGGGATISGFTPASGSPGTTVTVTGTNFTTDSTVTINGVAAVVTSVTSTQIIFSIPLMSDFTGPITITTSWGAVTSSGSLAVARASSLYWSAYNDGSLLPAFTGGIVQVGKNGGATTNLKSGLTDLSHLAVDSTSVYWSETNSSGTVKKVGINNGTVTSLATGLRYPYGIAVDSESVYWVEQNSTDGSAIVMKVAISGGAKTTVAAHPPSGLTCSNCTATAFSIAVDSTNVYWTEPLGRVYKAIKTGGTMTLLASGTIASGNVPSSIAVDSTSVYWIDNTNIKKIGANGGAVTTLATGSSPAFVAVDSTSVYWIDGVNIRKTGINGGAVTTLASGTSPSCIAVDATSVYWVDGLYIMKVAINGGTATVIAGNAYGPPRSIAVDIP